MKSRILAAGIAAGVIAATPGMAAAQGDADVPAASVPELELPVASTTVTLPGVGITLHISVDEAGHLTEVQLLDASGGAARAVKTEQSADEVRFVLEDDGTEISVEIDTDEGSDPKLEIAVETPRAKDDDDGDRHDGDDDDGDDQGRDDHHVAPAPSPSGDDHDGHDDDDHGDDDHGDDDHDDDHDDDDHDDDDHDDDHGEHDDDD